MGKHKKNPSEQGKKQELGDYEVGYKKPPKSGQIKKGEVRNPKGVNASNFLQLRKIAQQMGNELAYKANGEPVKIRIGGELKHVTYIELMLWSWMTDKKHMAEFRDTAFGKVPQNFDLTSQGLPLWKAFIEGAISDDKPKASDNES